VIKVPGGAVLRGRKKTKRKILAHLQQRPEHLAAASSAGTSLEAKLKHITVTLATWGAMWDVYLDPNSGCTSLQTSTMSGGKWQRLTREDEARTEELGRAADPNSQDQQELVREMKEHLKKKNFGRPVEWALVQDHPWSTPQLRKLDTPVDVEGKPWKE
ncbi:DNA-directed RNA polymerase subunit beta, partial [Haematococcus lacustris]